MTSSEPCPACSWTIERQKCCHYHSHVKLFYGCGDRGVWSLGSNLILKERGRRHRGHEAPNVRFVREITSIPVPEIVEDWEEDGHAFTISRRVPGKTLHEAWPDLSDKQKNTIAQEVAEYLMQLRKLQSDKMQALGGRPIYCDFLFLQAPDDRTSNCPHGPLTSDAELWAEMEPGLKEVPEAARIRLQHRMPPAQPYTFTHCDLTDVNIMVEDGHLTGILDWEMSGYFPVWWEYVGTSIGDSLEDSEWKDLLRQYMPDYEEAREFWRDYYYLSFRPESDRAKAFLEQTQQERAEGGSSAE